MQVEMTHVGTDITGPTDADEGVQIRAVHVHLPASGMNQGTDFLNRRLKDPVR